MNAVLEPSTCHKQHHCSSFSGVNTCTDQFQPKKQQRENTHFCVSLSLALPAHPTTVSNLCQQTFTDTTQWWLIRCKVLHNHRSGNWL